MENYNAFADILNTFRLSPDWIKALWLLTIPLCLAILAGIIRLPHLKKKAPENPQSLAFLHQPTPLLEDHSALQPPPPPCHSPRQTGRNSGFGTAESLHIGR